MKVLITGANGFIGSNLARSSLSGGNEVICPVRDFPPDGGLHRQNILGRVTLVHAELSVPRSIVRVLHQYRPELVLHCAAHAIVADAFKEPAYTVMNNVGVSVSLMEALRLAKEALPDLKCIALSCYDEQSHAVTTDGLKGYNELSVGDIIFSLDTETGRIVESPIEEVIVQDYVGPMVSFERRPNFRVTPNHRMLIERRGKFDYVRADSFVPSNGWRMPVGTWEGSPVSIPVVDKPQENIKENGNTHDLESLFYLLGIYIGDGYVQHQTSERPGKTGLGRSEYRRSHRGADGKFVRSSSHPSDAKVVCRSNTVFLYIPRNDKSRLKIESSLRRLGVSFSDWNHGGEGAIWFTSHLIGALFDTAGNNAMRKMIPRWAMGAPSGLLAKLFEGLMDSDGHQQSGIWTLHTVSRRLASDAAELAIKCGFRPSIYHADPPRVPPTIRGRAIRSNPNGSYQIRAGRPAARIRRENRFFSDYSGKVWCLRVPHKNFLVERLGHFDFCGNTDKVFGETKGRPYTEGDAFDPSGPYEASKACSDLVIQSYARSYGLDVVTLRSCNVYGPGDANLSRIIPKIAHQLATAGKVRLLRGSPVRREYIHVADVCSAFSVAEMGFGRLNRGVWHIGSGERLTVEEILGLFRGAGDFPVEWEEKPMPFPEIRDQAIDSAAFRERTGWLPKVGAAAGISEVLRWAESYWGESR